MPLIWGLTFPLIHSAIANIPPTIFVLLRFGLATLCILPFLKKSRQDFSRYMIYAGLILGLVNIGIFLFQTIGLQTVAGPRTAFITSLSVVMVPFLSPLLGLGKPKLCDYAAALLCMLGIYYLTGASLTDFSTGDAWIFGCAIATALSIVIIQKVSGKIEHASNFAFLQIAFTVFWVLPTLVIPLPASFSFSASLSQPIVLGALMFCAFIATVLAFFLQVKYQQYITAFKAALILALEPVFATLFAALFFGAHITLPIIIGGSLVVLSTLLSDVYKYCQHTFFIKIKDQ